MPMLDVYIPTGALGPDAERILMDDLTSLLLRAELYLLDQETLLPEESHPESSPR